MHINLHQAIHDPYETMTGVRIRTQMWFVETNFPCDFMQTGRSAATNLFLAVGV